LPLTVFALVALAGVAGAWTYARPRLKAMTPAPESSEEVLLREAKKFCTSDDCEAAHERVQSEIPEASRWRNSQDFKDIERQWAEVVLGRAGREPDSATKRALYQRVAQAMSVDAERRKLAADRLQDLDSSGRTVATDPMALPPMTVKPHPDDLLARPEASRKAAAPTGDAVVPLASAASSNHAAASVDDRVRQLALVGTTDSKVQLRQELEPRVYSGRASEAEVRLLISTCKDLSDKACVQQARAALKQVETASP